MKSKTKLPKEQVIAKTSSAEWELMKNDDIHFECHFSFSEKKNQRVFLASEIAKSLGHTNATQAMKACELIENKDYIIVKKSKHPQVFQQLTNLKLVGSRSGSITILYESGVWLLSLGSRLEKGTILRRYLADEVLPSIRKKGFYAPSGKEDRTLALHQHMDINVQKDNSKIVNGVNYEKGGVKMIIEHNAKLCYEFTGKFPNEIKLNAKERGLPSRVRVSAKEVLRHDEPATACMISFADYAVSKGTELRQVVDLAKRHLAPVYNKLLEWGMKPGELAV